MPIFTAIASFVAGAVGITSAFGVAAVNLGVRVLATSVISSLISKRDTSSSPSASGTSAAAQAGSRIQLSPATDNKLGIVYGSAFVSPILVDAKISTDQKTMWWVMALCEVTDTGTLSLGNVNSLTNSDIFWGDKQLVFGGADKTKVTAWINSNGETDTKCAGYLEVYLYRNGSSLGANTATTAINLLSDSQITPDQRWNSSRYTSTGKSPTMYRTAFAVVKMIYNQDAGITNLDQFKIKVTNSLTKPGEVIYDYLTNARYGCGIPTSLVDAGSLESLNTYSDQLISYKAVDGSSATQPRYRINGPVNTGQTCLQNLQTMVDSCDSWLQWDESVAKWAVVMNQSYLDYTTYDDLFIIDSSNITSGVNVTPIDLNSSFNVVESQFPNSKIKDQSDYSFVYLPTEDQNPNEPINKLTVQLPLVNNSVQAQYLATRRLIQSREDLIVSFGMDYSGIQIDAGDVVRVRHPVYGWGPFPANLTNPDKLFRVEQVQEAKAEDGSLGVSLTLIEYNNQVYENINIDDYQPAANTGITDPTIIGTPAAPTITNINTESNTFDVQCIIPNPGSVIAMEFWYGPTPTIVDNNYKLWDTQTNSTTPVYTAGDIETTSVVGFQPSTYYWAVRAITQTTKSAFSGTTSQSWAPTQPAARTLCEQTLSQAVVYSDTFKLYSANTRGSVLTCGITPAENGSDFGGKATNQIQLDVGISAYSATQTNSLVSEVYMANDYFRKTVRGLCTGTNGFLMVTTNNIMMLGAIVPSPDPTAHELSCYSSVFTSTDQLNACAAKPNMYVVGGANGKMFYSATGYNNWTAATTPTDFAGKTIYDIIYVTSLNLFVAVGGILSGPVTGGTAFIMTSSDGITWTTRLNQTSKNGLLCVAFNGTTFMAIGNSFLVANSTNGTTWTNSYASGGSTFAMYGLTWNATSNLWIAVGDSYPAGGNRVSKIVTTPDTNNWTVRYTGAANTSLRGVANYFNVYNDNFAAGAEGEIVYSSNGTTWTSQPSPFTGTYNLCKQFDGKFYLMGENIFYNNVITSPPLVWDVNDASQVFQVIAFWDTYRIWNFGSSPNSSYDNTTQAVQDQLPNNIPVAATIKTGAYLAGVPVKFILVAGNLNNPSTPVTTFAGRKSLAITEFKG